MNQYVIKLGNGKYMKYDQIDSFELLVDDTDSVLHADTFDTYERAMKFAKCINARKDGEYRILSYENAVSVVELSRDYEWCEEHKVLQFKKTDTVSYLNFAADVFCIVI